MDGNQVVRKCRRPNQIVRRACRAVECVTCSLQRQYRNVESFAAGRDDGDSGGNAETDVTELAQIIHNCIDFLGISSPWVQHRFRIVEDYHNFLGGQEQSERSQVLQIFDTCTEDIGEPMEGMGARGGKLVASDELTVAAEPLLVMIVAEDRQRNGCLANAASTDEGDLVEVLGQVNYLLDQLAAAKEDPRWWRW